jgi:hypothetical protein
MVRVQVQFDGEGTWRSMLLPLPGAAAHTVAIAAQRLGLGDHVQVAPAGIDRVLDIWT